MAVATLPRSGRSRPRVVRPHQVTVDRHRIVGQRMDYMARASDALNATGAAQQLLGRVAGDPITFEIHRALHDSRKALVALLTDLRADAGWLDGMCEDPHRHPGHGNGA